MNPCDDIFKALEQAKIDGDTTSLYQAIKSWWKLVRPTTRWDRTKLGFVVGSSEAEGA